MCFKRQGISRRMVAAQFLHDLIAAVPCKLYTVLTDSGIKFTNRQRDTLAFVHIFERVCHAHGIEHRLTPYEDSCQYWQKEPERFTVNPCHHTVGLNT